MAPLLAVVATLALTAAVPRDAGRVAVIRNANSAVSREVADFYARSRGVRNVITVACQDSTASADTESMPYKEFATQVEAPVRAFLAAHPRIDFLVLTKGVPLRILNAPGLGLLGTMPSVDSYLAALGYGSTTAARKITISDSGFNGTCWVNRYWNSDQRFSHARFGGYLVTRLDGYTKEDAMALVTRAIEAEKRPPTGSVLLDACPDFGFGDAAAQPIPPVANAAVNPPVVAELEFKHYNADMARAADLLRLARVPVDLVKTGTFVSGRGLIGYVSWGSNDRKFDAAAYHALAFAPGAVCETAVSTSARTFLPTKGGQSLIADLVAQGCTGAKGYCNEPLLQAVASPSILFNRYTRGWTLAESFYAASRFVGWEDIVLGDPLCAPYWRTAAHR